MATQARFDEQTQTLLEDTFRQTSDFFNRGIETAARLNQDSVRFWTDAMNRGFDEARRNWDRFSDETGLLRESATRLQQTIEEQSARGLDMLRQSFELGRSRDAREWSDKAVALWRNSVDASLDAINAGFRYTTDLCGVCTSAARDAGRQAAESFNRSMPRNGTAHAAGNEKSREHRTEPRRTRTRARG